MKTVSVLSQALFLSFVIALSVHASEEQRPQRPSRAEMEKKIENLKTLCAQDIASFCAEAEGPHVIGCLKHNQDALTVEACQQEVAQIPDRPPHPNHRPPAPPESNE